VLPTFAFAQPERVCIDLVNRLIEESDGSYEQGYEAVTWPDGIVTDDEGKSRRFHDVYFRGAGRVARTFQQDVRWRSISPTLQEVTNKEIVQLYERGHFSGAYLVHKNRYRCERRGGQWRILSQRWLSRSIGTNDAAKREWQRIMAE
jgi:hypothetical protein